MPSENGHSRDTIDELARRIRSELNPINKQFSWFPMTPVAEEDQRQYLQDPYRVVASLPALCAPKIGVVLAPYLEKGTGRAATAVAETKPAEAKLALSARVENPDFVTIFFTVKGEQVADYHYFFYDEIAAMLSHRWPKKVSDAWHGLLREELSGEMHGEVDERSWRLKQALLRRPMNARRDGKPFREYARQSFEDTMTLYLHGICCDIDVDTGPRQLPSRCLRKRLELLKSQFLRRAAEAYFPKT